MAGSEVGRDAWHREKVGEIDTNWVSQCFPSLTAPPFSFLTHRSTVALNRVKAHFMVLSRGFGCETLNSASLSDAQQRQGHSDIFQ